MKNYLKDCCQGWCADWRITLSFSLLGFFWYRISIGLSLPGTILIEVVFAVLYFFLPEAAFRLARRRKS